MDEKKKKLDDILEGYKPIPMKRMFYPRGMKLSEDFVNAFHKEYDRLVGEGLNPKTLVERFGKAMSFHINDPRKYNLLDEEKDTANKDDSHKSKLSKKVKEEDPSPRNREIQRRKSLGSSYRSDEENLDDQARDRD